VSYTVIQSVVGYSSCITPHFKSSVKFSIMCYVMTLYCKWDERSGQFRIIS
jgi:hypothetical protein